MREIQKKVDKYIQNEKLIKAGDTVVIGVSGGADSMMLVDYMYTSIEKYKIQLKVAHVHHGIREEADYERDYVEEWCKQRNIPCFIHYCDIRQLSKEKKMSEEEVGRMERYNFFISLTNEYDKIAVAHHMNDQAETMMMHFFRGADIKGLGGIQSKRNQIIRPLLNLSRREIEAYCKAKNIRYYDDISNFTTVYTRNRIRLECMPYIEKYINPNICETLFRQGELYQEAYAFIEEYTDKLFSTCAEENKDEIKLNVQILEEQMVYMQKQVIYKAITQLAKEKKDISQVHVQTIVELMRMQTGKEIHLPYRIIAKKQYNQIIFKVQDVDIFTNYEYTLELGINKISRLDFDIELRLCTLKTFEQYKENMYTIYVDYDRIKDNLQLRPRRSGDFMTLASGKKKLKKIFIDDKVPQTRRQMLPLLADQDEIVWIIGSRVNSRYFVTSKTKNILEIKMNKYNTQEGLC